MTPQTIDVRTFVRAETDRMLQRVLQDTGGINRWLHNRVPTPLDHQPVIRQNRDTLYSGAVVDASEGFTVTVPDAGGRYLSVMVVDQDHYVPAVWHGGGSFTLSREQAGTDYVLVAVRTLVDPEDPDDVATVNALQDQLRLDAPSGRPFDPPPVDPTSFTTTREALLSLASGLPDFRGAFGRKEDVDPVRHLLGTAAGWGGLPETEAFYLNVSPGLPLGEYQLTVGEVPVDGFWSVSVYNADGYFEPNPQGVNSVNSVTAQRDPDGSTTVRFGQGDAPNTLPITEGWNYLVRLYQPRPEVLDGTWTFPSLTASPT